MALPPPPSGAAAAPNIPVRPATPLAHAHPQKSVSRCAAARSDTSPRTLARRQKRSRLRTLHRATPPQTLHRWLLHAILFRHRRLRPSALPDSPCFAPVPELHWDLRAPHRFQAPWVLRRGALIVSLRSSSPS